LTTRQSIVTASKPSRGPARACGTSALPTPCRALGQRDDERKVDAVRRDAQVARSAAIEQRVADDAPVALATRWVKRSSSHVPAQSARSSSSVSGCRRRSSGGDGGVGERALHRDDCIEVVRASKPHALARPGSGSRTASVNCSPNASRNQTSTSAASSRAVDAVAVSFPPRRQCGVEIAQELRLGRGAAAEVHEGVLIGQASEQVCENSTVTQRDDAVLLRLELGPAVDVARQQRLRIQVTLVAVAQEPRRSVEVLLGKWANLDVRHRRRTIALSRMPKTLTGAELQLDDGPARDAELFLVDGNNLAYRAFFALPRSLRRPRASRRMRCSASRTCSSSSSPTTGPKGVAVAWDTRAVHRHELSEDYKSDRRPMPDLLGEQFPYFRPIVEAFGYRNLEFEGWEADDVIATLATMRRRGGSGRSWSRPTATRSSSSRTTSC
jgi:hypothetical protein